jgi:hypothetical protein
MPGFWRLYLSLPGMAILAMSGSDPDMSHLDMSHLDMSDLDIARNERDVTALAAREHTVVFLSIGVLRRATEIDAGFAELDLGFVDGCVRREPLHDGDGR